MFSLLGLILLSGASLGCAPSMAVFSQAPHYDYPAPLSIGTPQQQERLAELARAATYEIDDSERLRLMVELASLVDEMRPLGQHDDAFDEIGGFLAKTALISFMKRQYGPDAARPEVWALSTKAPGELVGLRLTAPEHWTNPGARLMGSEPTVVRRALEHAGVFERDGEGAGRYDHASVFLTEENLRRLEEEDVFDPFIGTVFSKNRLAASRISLHAIEVRNKAVTPEARHEQDRRLSAIMDEIGQVEILLLRREDLYYQRAQIAASGADTDHEDDQMEALSRPIQEGLLRLARYPEWGVHLYIGSVIGPVREWQKPELLQAVRAHGNPISLRFFEPFPLPQSTTRGAKLDIAGYR